MCSNIFGNCHVISRQATPNTSAPATTESRSMALAIACCLAARIGINQRQRQQIERTSGAMTTKSSVKMVKVTRRANGAKASAGSACTNSGQLPICALHA